MPEAHYLVLKLRDLDKRVYGDFQFKCEFKNGCKFYFWLNVKALLYNEELREITKIRNEHRQKMINEDPDYKDRFEDFTTQERYR